MDKPFAPTVSALILGMSLLALGTLGAVAAGSGGGAHHGGKAAQGDSAKTAAKSGQSGQSAKSAKSGKSAPPVVKIKVHGTLQNAIGRLRRAAASNGLMVMGRINQGALLSQVGLHVQSESLLVGNPMIGQKLFSASHAAGIAVPMRINFYVNQGGKTMVAYVKPSYILHSFKDPKLDKMAKRMDGKLHKLAMAAAH